MTPDHFLAVGKATGIYAFMTTSYGWPMVESLHFIGLAVLLGTVGLFDLRVLGLGRSVPLSALHRLVPFGVAAYLSNVATGSMFFLTFPNQYLYNPAFQTKLCFMALAGVNVIAFYAVARRALRAGEYDVEAPPLVRVFAAVSLGAWLGVIVCGRVITLFRPPYYWCYWC